MEKLIAITVTANPTKKRWMKGRKEGRKEGRKKRGRDGGKEGKEGPCRGRVEKIGEKDLNVKMK